MEKLFKPVLLVLLLVAYCAVNHAQTTTSASISGTVYDDKNAVLPGANITAVHVPSGTKYVTSSRENGEFSLPSVRTGGPYTVTVTFVGYQNTVINDIYLILGQNQDLTATLSPSVGNIAEVVISGRQDPTFNVDHNGSGTNINNSEISSIPTSVRSINDMTKLTPQSNYGSSYSEFLGRSDLYNNLTINGALFNNTFGLAAQIGGQTNAQPISLDAIEQVQISLSPYDVRQGGFSGANINAVTRSGTNEFSGSVYRYWKNQNFVGTKIHGTTVPLTNFNFYQNGFRFGGPIIKDKLFFFISGEMEQNQAPVSGYVAAQPGVTGSNVANINKSTLDSLANFLISKYNYNPGSYQGATQNTQSQKVLVRLDYNISQNHKLDISYNYLASFQDNKPPSGETDGPTTLYFSGNSYSQHENMNSIVAELNSTFGNHISNNFIAGYTGIRNYRGSPSSAFPMVKIYNGSALETSFGMEQYTPNNRLYTDEYQISDNFTMNFGLHTVTLGGSYEYYSTQNGFTPEFDGIFYYNSLSDFYNDAEYGKKVTLREYEYQYSALSGVPIPFANLHTAQIGFYIQDAYKVNKQLKLTYGIRFDVPSYPVSIPQNQQVLGDKFLDQNGNTTSINVSKLPNAVVEYSPRVGFNWDVFGNKTTQLRGGIGIFTGRVPLVWISNQVSNDGVSIGQTLVTNTTAYPFNPNPNAYAPANPTAGLPATYAINATASNLKWPQTLRTTIALDQKLPGGVIGTIEGVFSQTINDVFLGDFNLVAPTAGVRGDGRAVFPSPYKINANINNAYVIFNTNLGNSFYLTAQLKKTFEFSKQVLDVNIAYTYSETKDAYSDAGSTESTWFSSHPVSGNPNHPRLAYSDFDQPHKLVGYLKYRIEYANHLASSLSIVYTGYQSGRYNYTYNGDYNGDGNSSNDLIYIPRNQSEINLVNISATNTSAMEWTALNNYINQDPYLSKHRGQIMQRNGGVYPWRQQYDIKFVQDLFTNVGGKRNTLEFTLDILNFANMLNSSWGNLQRLSVTTQYTPLLSVVKGPADANNNPPVTFTTPNPNSTFSTNFTPSSTYSQSSTWQLQMGLRYIFN